MPSVLVLLMVMMVILYGNVEIVECLEMDENDPESIDREIRTMCHLNPTIDICAENAIEKRKSSYMRFGRLYPAIFAAEPHLSEKRKSAYMRFGKRYVDSNDYVKRKSAYMRFGR
ncbi:hypothetical protein LOAG_10025 [Loa loa]|uniref:Uncharacterized protein n=1 Tax=Loa loa TaxID=7209 RepID=A0A1I7VRP3_LOALO|nr:hypothetical protein LOAG_10025 [Loa loa]EFO18468.2 hypothetical protein LOAG_10025 [Loa loa]